MKAGAPKGNKNAEKWTDKEIIEFFENAIQLSKKKINHIVGGVSVEGYKYDFIGEIARDLDLYIDIFDYFIEKNKEYSKYKTIIMRNCEANCFSNAKKGLIKEATAIVNLKSNHKWTDRLENNNSGNITINWSE